MNVFQVDLVISGVGGQGVLTLASLMGTAAIIEGYDARVSEVHGMAQRGGSVICHVRYGVNVNSPLVMEGRADAIIAMELSEAIKAASYLKKGGIAIVNRLEFPPPLSTIRGLKYPTVEEVAEMLQSKASQVYLVDAQSIAEKVGSPLLANVVMLGAAWSSGCLKLNRDSIIQSIKQHFKGGLVELNVNAFEEGIKALSTK